MKIPRVMCFAALLLAASAQQPASEPPKAQTTRTRVVLLGTDTPVPDPDRSGPATAIVVDDSAYLVDFGPGVVRRAKAAVFDRYITALEPANLRVAFCDPPPLRSHGGLFRSHPDRMDRRPAHAARSLRSDWTEIDDRASFAGVSARH